MINEATRELIQAGVDGELDASGQRELEAVLESSGEARELHEELTHLNQFLAQVPPTEPPDDLHSRIMSSVDLPRPSGLRSLFDFSGVPALLRYGFAGAAGLLLAVAVYEVRDPSTHPADLSNMAGTMVRGGTVEYTQVLDQQEISHDLAKGQAILGRQGDNLLLDIVLESQQKIEFGIDFSNQPLNFQALAQQDRGLQMLEYRDQMLAGELQGPVRIVVLLEAGSKGEWAGKQGIELKFTAQGKLVHEGQLRPES